jgi:membrane-bound metal-dependent hydrolase YbcI (DUF457 family)
MNYLHHALIGIGTAGLGIAAAEALGLAPLPMITLGIGTLVVGTGSIATDLDHPKSFISNSIPSGIIRLALVVLLIPILAGLATVLSTQDVPGTWADLAGLIFEVNFLRLAFIALGMALGLMLISWLLYKSLHHRGPLHSLYITLAATTVACVISWWFWLPWTWGLAFGWGWLWHILADGLTEQGVPIYWPFNEKRLHTLPPLGCTLGRPLLSVLAVSGIILLTILQISG